MGINIIDKQICHKDSLKKSKGTTLAELMLVLTIIGSLATFTVPQIIYNVNKAICFTMIVKMYSALSQATNLALQDKGGNFLGQFNDADDIANEYAKYLSVQKTCTKGNSVGHGYCFVDKISYLNGQDYPYMGWVSAVSAGFVLNNGVLILIYDSNAYNYSVLNCNVDNVPNNCSQMFVDVNGWRGPNKIGVDEFLFQIEPNKLAATSDAMDPAHPCVYPPAAGWDGVDNQGWTCTSKVITGEIH